MEHSPKFAFEENRNLQFSELSQTKQSDNLSKFDTVKKNMVSNSVMSSKFQTLDTSLKQGCTHIMKMVDRFKKQTSRSPNKDVRMPTISKYHLDTLKQHIKFQKHRDEFDSTSALTKYLQQSN